MAQPLPYDPPPAPPGQDAFTAADDLARLLETLHTSGTLRVLNGLLARFQDVMAVVLAGLDSDAGRATRTPRRSWTRSPPRRRSSRA